MDDRHRLVIARAVAQSTPETTHPPARIRDSAQDDAVGEGTSPSSITRGAPASRRAVRVKSDGAWKRRPRASSRPRWPEEAKTPQIIWFIADLRGAGDWRAEWRVQSFRRLSRWRAAAASRRGWLRGGRPCGSTALRSSGGGARQNSLRACGAALVCFGCWGGETRFAIGRSNGPTVLRNLPPRLQRR